MNILVTGGSGFIGSNFIHYWMKKHPFDNVTNLDNLTYAANPKSLNDLKDNKKYFFVKGDICDRKIVKEACRRIDILVHFAAESHVDRSINDPSIFIKTNVLGTFNLLDAALKNKIKKFHHISTDEVFGSIPLGSRSQFNEKTIYNPSSPYSASKAASDHLVRVFHKTYGLPITITNCSNNYGPYQHPEKLIPRAVTNIIDGKKVPVYGRGKNFRDWLFVEDHCRAIELVLRKGIAGETYCVGGLTGGVSNIGLIKMILKLMGKSDSFEYIKDRPAHDNYSVNWKKINKQLGWKPSHDLESGLKETIKWYTANESWWRPLKKEAERFYKKLERKPA